MLGGDEDRVHCLAVAPNSRIVTGSHDGYVKVWCDGACEHTFDKFGDDAHIDEMTGDAPVNAVAVLPGGARFVSASNDETAKLWTLEGGFERIRAGCGAVRRGAADGAHFVVGLGFGFDEDEDEQHEDSYSLKLYHVDGRSSAPSRAHRVRVGGGGDDRWPTHHRRLEDHLVMVWSVATKSLVSICHGHTNDVLAVAAIPDGRILGSGAYPDIAIRVWHLRGISSTAVPFASHRERVQAARRHEVEGPRGPARQPARALRSFNNQALRRQRRRRDAHFRTTLNGLPPGAAARRPPLRQLLGRQRRDRPARPRAVSRLEMTVNKHPWNDRSPRPQHRRIT